MLKFNPPSPLPALIHPPRKPADPEHFNKNIHSVFMARNMSGIYALRHPCRDQFFYFCSFTLNLGTEPKTRHFFSNTRQPYNPSRTAHTFFFRINFRQIVWKDILQKGGSRPSPTKTTTKSAEHQLSPPPRLPYLPYTSGTETTAKQTQPCPVLQLV